MKNGRMELRLLFVLCFCFSTVAEASLDIGEYLKHADGDVVYPTARQVQMLQSVMPNESFHPAPAINDRVYWSKIAASESGKEWLNEAISELDK